VGGAVVAREDPRPVSHWATAVSARMTGAGNHIQILPVAARRECARA
jgi:hypothetical protein